MRWVASSSLSLVALTVLAGCDGDGAGGSCGKVEPCGGEVVGDWKVGVACLNRASLMGAVPTALATVCAAATLGDVAVQTSGSLSFTADMTYTASLTLDASVKVNIPASCLGGLSCALANVAVQAALAQDPEPTIKSVTCAGTASCVCTVVSQPQVTDETGTYAKTGTVLTLTSSAAVTDVGDYCVQGKELHLVSLDRSMNLGPMGQATITEDIVATKL
jgi:hypothetical protein